MDILYERCCGLDVHKQTVVACVLLPGSGRQPAKEIRTFGTMTADLIELGDWLAEKGVTHVALESTGVYWHAVWNLLEATGRLSICDADNGVGDRMLAKAQELTPDGVRQQQTLVLDPLPNTVTWPPSVRGWRCRTRPAHPGRELGYGRVATPRPDTYCHSTCLPFLSAMVLTARCVSAEAPVPDIFKAGGVSVKSLAVALSLIAIVGALMPSVISAAPLAAPAQVDPRKRVQCSIATADPQMAIVMDFGSLDYQEFVQDSAGSCSQLINSGNWIGVNKNTDWGTVGYIAACEVNLNAYESVDVWMVKGSGAVLRAAINYCSTQPASDAVTWYIRVVP